MGFFAKRRQLKALQIEVTSRCPRGCDLCPRTALADRWKDGDMAPSTWERIEPALVSAEHVHLQGWGEPLLQPSLASMVRSAKRAGATVGITTNGDLLESAADWIAGEEVDLLTVSVGAAAGTRSTGSSSGPALDAVRALTARKRKPRSRPKVQISHLLTRDNAADLPSLVEAAASVGVQEVFVVHLDVTPTESLRDRRAFTRNGLVPGVAAYLDAAEKTARRFRVRFRGPARQAEELLACALNPERFAFVSWDGRVGPCVNLLLPIDGTIARWNDDGFREVEPVCYGSLRDDTLPAILAGETRTGFVKPFRRRLAAEREFQNGVFEVWGAESLRRLDRLDGRRDDILRETPFPEACAGCPKQMGW